MFHFNKDVEYALISLVEMSKAEGDTLFSARVLSDRFSIPYKLLARTLQALRAHGILNAVQGPRGGYQLAKKPEETQLGDVIQAVRGNEKIADCLDEKGHCIQEECGCTIKPIIQVFQEKWINFMKETTLDEFSRLGTSPAMSRP